jgi:hypothetical protein
MIERASTRTSRLSCRVFVVIAESIYVALLPRDVIGIHVAAHESAYDLPDSMHVVAYKFVCNELHGIHAHIRGSVHDLIYGISADTYVDIREHGRGAIQYV